MDQFAPLLLANALLLGFRHGFDWDHIAAIFDIVGSTSNNKSLKTGSGGQTNAIGLAALYALGHAFMCLILGFLALYLHLIAPVWVDNFMERIVGLTLIALGTLVLFSIRSGHATPRSGWILVLTAVRRTWLKLRTKPDAKAREFTGIGTYGAKTAFGIGVIHGIGAETATQILMISSIASANTKAAGVSILLLFVLGLVMSNLLVSIMAFAGFFASAYAKRFLQATSLFAGAFSIAIGIAFLAGSSATLPDLKDILAKITAASITG